MKKQILLPDPLYAGRHLLKWFLLTLPLALITGSLVALFLWLLDKVTQYRWAHAWLLWLLPLAGVVIHLIYQRWGRSAARGNNLILDEIHQPGGGVPPRMAPLILLTTVMTHLFGGSAGREGTAVQVGGSMAAWIARLLRLAEADARILLMAGIAAGFGAVFGTPVAGAVFALEVLSVGRVQYDALLPCFMASLLADGVAGAWGIRHISYPMLFHEAPGALLPFFPVDVLLMAKVTGAGIIFGLAARTFTALTHGIRQRAAQWIKPQWLIPAAGGLLIIALTGLAGTDAYLGLGVQARPGTPISIVNAFRAGGVTSFSWCWKLLFTAVTLGMGFKGGEVTPLFFIGAALGNTLAVLSGAPVDLMAGLGFIAVFAGAANTPLACVLMGVELWGGEHLPYYAAACCTAYYFSGRSGIYAAQRTVVHKPHAPSD